MRHPLLTSTAALVAAAVLCVLTRPVGARASCRDRAGIKDRAGGEKLDPDQDTVG